MDRDLRFGVVYFLILFFVVIIPKIITYLAYVIGIDLPPLTVIFIFPFIAFLPPILAVFFSMHIEKPKISFIFSFSSIIAGAFVHEVLTYGATGLLRIPSLQSLMLWILGAIGLGLIGYGVSMRKGKTELRLSFFLTGMIFWIALVIEGVYRWLSLIIGLIR